MHHNKKKFFITISFVLCLFLLTGNVVSFAGDECNRYQQIPSDNHDPAASESAVDEIDESKNEDANETTPKVDFDKKENVDKKNIENPEKTSLKDVETMDTNLEDDLDVKLDTTSMNGNSDEYEIDLIDSHSNTQTLLINATFKDVTNEKKLKISLSNGLGFDSLPGMSSMNSQDSNWRWRGLNLPSSLEEVLIGGQYVPNSYLVDGYQPKAGTITYTIASDVDKICLEVKLIGDPTFLIEKENLVLSDAINVTTAEEQSIIKSQTLERYIVKNMNVHLSLKIFGLNSIYYAGEGQEYRFPYMLRLENGSKTLGHWLNKGIYFEVSMPKGSGLKDIDLIGQSSTTLKKSDYTTTLDAISSSNKDILKVFIKEGTNTATPLFNIVGVIPEKTSPKSSFSVRGENAYFISQSGEKIDARSFGTMGRIIVSENGDSLTFPAIRTSSVNAMDKNSPADLCALGGFGVANPNAKDIKGQKMLLEFTDDSIGVKAVKILAGLDGANKINVNTTDNRKLSYTRNKLTDFHVGSSGNKDDKLYKTLNLFNDLKNGEYVSSVEYDMGTIFNNINSDTSNSFGLSYPESTGIFYFGRILKEVDSYSAKATTFKPTVSGAGIDDTDKWVKDIEKTQPIKVEKTSNYKLTYSLPGSGASNVIAGSNNKYSMNRTFSLSNLSRGGYQYLRAIKGFEMYIREPEELLVDPNSIVVKNSLNKIVDGIEIKNYRDKMGKKVYKITAKEEVIGAYTSDLKRSSLNLAFNYNVKSIAANKVIPMSDIVFGNVIDQSDIQIEGSSGSSGLVYTNNGDFVTDDSGNFNDDTSLKFMTPGTGAKITIKSQSTFSVAISADKGDGDWKYYIPDDDSTVMDIKSSERIRYRVEGVNTTSKPAINGYTVMVPVPKKGENSGSDKFQSDPFEWSLYLNKDIAGELGNDYDVKYATSYITDREHSQWKDWNEITSKEKIKTIKVHCKKMIPPDEKDNFMIELNMPKGDEAINAGDKINKYSSAIYTLLDGNGIYKSSDQIALKLKSNRSYKVIFDGNGADQEASPRTKTVTVPNTTIDKLPSPPTKTGYVFSGWYMNKQTTGVKFTDRTTVNKDMTVYAKWVPKYYSLSFNLNGGKGKPPMTQSLRSGALAEKVKKPAKTNSKFLHWNTKADGSGRQWDFSTTKMPVRNVVLYAQWKDGNAVTPGENGGKTTTIYYTTNNKWNRFGNGASGNTYLTNYENANDSGNMNSNPPDASIAEQKVPVSSRQGTWSLFNLIMSIAGGLLAIGGIVLAILYKRKKHDEEDEYSKYDEGDEEKKKVRLPFIVVSIILALAAIVLFILTQDMRLIMEIFDKWSIVHLIIFIVQLAFIILSFRKKKEEYKEEVYEY